MYNLLNFLLRAAGKTVIIIAGIAALVVGTYQLFHLSHKVVSYLTKKSYSREITVTFDYKGDNYVIKSNARCINKGVVSSKESMEWFTHWNLDYDHKNEVITLKDGETVKFGLGCPFNQDFWSIIFEREIKGFASEVCDAFLFDDDGINKSSRGTKYYPNDEHLELVQEVITHRKTLGEYDEYLKNKPYSNEFGNLVYIISTKDNPKLGKHEQAYKHLEIQIQSIAYGEKRSLPTTFFNWQ